MKRSIGCLVAAMLFAGPALADSTINALTAGAALGGTEQLPMFQGSNPAVTTTPSAIRTYTNTGVNHPGYKSGNWYTPINVIEQNPSGGGPALLTAHCGIGQIGGNTSATISALAARLITPGTTIQLAIYNNDLSSGIARPGTLVDSTPNITATSGINVSGNLNTTHSIQPGFYWLCLQTDNTSLRYATPVNATRGNPMPLIGSTNLGNVFTGGPPDGVTTTTGVTSFGVWPTFVGATFTEDLSGLAPLVAVKFSSVP